MQRLAMTLILLTSSVVTCSAQYNFTTVDYPGATITRLVGINDHRDIVGNYTLPGGVRHALIFAKGQLAPLDPNGILGSNMSVANQINNRGDISGWYVDGSGRHGYVLKDGVVNTINYPGASFTQVNWVTDTEIVIGHFIGSDGHFHGFILQDGIFKQLDFPGANDTLPFYMNARRDLVGEWTPFSGIHGFLLTTDGQWTSIDAPGAPDNSTLAIGINDHNKILGEFFQQNGLPRVFIVGANELQSPEAFAFIDFPWPASFPETINNAGVFVGFYSDATGTHGFVATPAPAD